MHNERTPDAGDTLVEVLIALLIMGICIVAMMTGLVTSIAGSAQHRGLATDDVALTSFAETLKYDVELQAQPWYAECASVTSSSYNGNTIAFSPPAGYTTSITAIQYWNSSTNAFEPSTTSSAACSGNTKDHSGFQLLTLTATAPHGIVKTLQIGVRAPS